MTKDVRAFDLSGPLPTGRLAIEASAGTGKTHTLSTLAARYVIEAGVPVGEVLVVTFTRAAAAELRDRVRTRLVDAAEVLAAETAHPGHAPDDLFLAQICADDVEVRRERAQTALADFDAASITTIHGFAQQVLGTLGTAAPSDPDASLGDDGGDLLRQVCTDVLVAESLGGRHPAEMLLPLDTLVERGREVGGNPGVRCVPSPDPADSNEAAALRRRLVDEVMAEVDRRRRATGMLSFDDLLTRLRDALADPVSGPAARLTLRRRFRVGLIDEFQDTDPVQWEILQMLFGEDGSETSLVLVGDPKQAIYGFRGANVHTYLDAVSTPGTAGAVLTTNWRSDGALLGGVEALLAGATFGDDRIRFHPVEAVERHRDQRIRDAAGVELPALSIRLALDDDVQKIKNGRYFSTDDAERAIVADLATSVRELLDTGRLPDGGEGRSVRPSDIAVLVGGHADSPKVRDALKLLDIPAVITRGEHVLNSPAAIQWRWLLEGVAQPSDPLRARTVCLSWFVGWTANALAVSDDAALASVQERLHRWAETLITHGVADFRRQVWTDSGVAARVLATADGDRAMTDLDHLAELLGANVPRRTGPAGLLVELDRMAADAKTVDVEIDAAARRIESEAAAVQIMTVHAAKGLEFPIVCVPTLWRSSHAEARATIYRDEADGQRTVDVAKGVDWPTPEATTARRSLASVEAVGQNLRLLYVALTRAQHHTIVWWTRATSSDVTGLARVLFARDGAAIAPERFGAAKVRLPPDGDAAAFLDPMVAASAGTVAVAVIGAASARPEKWSGQQAEPPAALTVATLDRPLDRSRRRWSFTAITARVRGETLDPDDGSLGDAGAGDEGVEGEINEVVEDVIEADGDAAPHALLSNNPPAASLPLGALTGGTGFGILVHRVLEHLDFTAADLDAALHEQVAEAVRWEGLAVDEDALVAGLASSVRTPLGPRLRDRRLRDLARSDRLDELGFELTLGESGHPVDDSEIARLLVRHLGHGDPLRPWAEALVERPFGALLAGHLVGSIDAVLRVDDPGEPPRFVVVDYKTNTLTPRGLTPSIDDYHPDRLPDAMMAHDYPLQALLYSVALHRYLRWRIPAYDPAVHLGGIAYLFVRGMIGPETPVADGRPHGVFSWVVPPALVEDTSDLLDGRPVDVGIEVT